MLVARRRLVVLAVVLVIPGFAGVARAAMHLRLVKSVPAKDAVVGAPTQLQLWFSLKPMMAVTSVKLVGPSKAEVTLGKPAHSGDVQSPVEVSVAQPLAPGKYSVSWKTASSDMHPVSGTYGFTVK